MTPIARSLLVLSVCLLAGCRSSEPVASVTPALGYGYSADDAIRVGGAEKQSGPANERAYLDRLRGPDGQRVTYEREGSCCGFETPNGIGGFGMLDRYLVTYAGLKTPVILFLNMYDAPDEGRPAPRGFRFATADRE